MSNPEDFFGSPTGTSAPEDEIDLDSFNQPVPDFTSPTAGAGPAADVFDEATAEAGSSPTANTGNSPVASEQQAEFELPASSKLAQWQAARKEELAKRAAQAAAEKQLLVQAAQKDQEGFYSRKEERVSKAKAENREAEKTFRADIKNTNEFGTRWQKVAKMVNVKALEHSKPKKERLVQLLLQLKNDKEEEVKSQ